MPTLGLRLRIAILLLLPLALLAALAQWVLQRDMERNVAALEQTEATGDLQRVLASVEGQAQNLSGVLRSWAYWSAFYDHANQPDPAFREEELSVESLAAGQIDWLMLTGTDGQARELVEVAQPDGTLPASDDIRAQAVRYQDYFSNAAQQPDCGLVRAARRLSLLCYSPLRRSDGTGDFSGMVVIGRWVDAGMLAQVARQAGRVFHLDTTDEPPRATPVPRGRLFSSAAPRIVHTPGHLVLRVDAYSLFGRPVGELRMDWPRRDMTEATQRLAATQRVIVLLVVASGVLLVLLLDQLVVKRLARLRHELAAVMEEGHWHGSVTQHGRDEIGELAGFFNQLLDLVRRQMDELRDLSTTDALTGLPNRRAFDQRLHHLLARHTRQGSAAALIVFDVDHFKRYNDALGHPAGDEALRAIARCLRATARRRLDMPARIGGEEFGVLLEDAGTEDALRAAEAVRTAVEALAIPHPDHPDLPHMSVSGGVATFRAGDTAEALYQRADDALYAAKQTGRNRITLAP